MSVYDVTYEGESYTSEDDKTVQFQETTTSQETIPEDFMPKMFEYLESDLSYEILYQIKAISKDGKAVETKDFVSIIYEYEDGSKGGLLLKDLTDGPGGLSTVGLWNVSNISKVIDDIYSNPQTLTLVVVTLAESIAPTT